MTRPVDCSDPVAGLKQMFVDQVQRGRIDKGQCPAKRPVFLRLHGVAHGRLEVVPHLPEELRVGLFQPGACHPVWVRFSSDIPDNAPVLKSTVGIGLKIFDVDDATMDVTFQNTHIFFVDDAEQMCAFTRASLAGEGDEWLKDHPRTQEILDSMAKEVGSVLDTEYGSVIPFRFGPDRHCKYALVPESVPGTHAPDDTAPNYLARDLERRLGAGEARIRFCVQLQTDPDTMPLDQATVPWRRDASPFRHVATLVLPKQDITTRGQGAYGEQLAFNPGRTPDAHAPVGSIAEARKVVYAASAELRRDTNGQSVGEPAQPRPGTPYPDADAIVSARIHPAIGVCRLGDSPDGWYVGPEVPHPPAMPPGATRDESGRIKRQAARFRIYGYDAHGNVVRELTAAEAQIDWTVHVANRKAQWYRFIVALDLPESKAEPPATVRRNGTVKPPDRGCLAIDPGPRSLSGTNQSGEEHRFDTGTFEGVEVYLGEARTDEAGRLLVLGGHGVSASPSQQPIFDPDSPDTFNNADGWYDDTSDGPVTARVIIGDRELPVEPAWVICGPPDFAPDIVGWRTMYDLMTEVAMGAGWLPPPETVSFTEHILPFLERLNRLGWVNAGFASFFGEPGLDLSDPKLLARLGQAPVGSLDPFQELRRNVFNHFRPADNPVVEPRTWPWIYGDAYGTFDASPSQYLPLPRAVAANLERWVEGDFIGDYDPNARRPSSLEDYDPKDRPHALDEAAMTFCLADAFHPGCEMTWPMRHPTMYMAPYRIRHRPPGVPETDSGPTLTPSEALSPNGPLYAQGPGDLTRWMALPWQADTAFCRAGYDSDYDPYVPTFWAANVPNTVVSPEDYAVIMDDTRSHDERLEAFYDRDNWMNRLTQTGASAPEVMLAMVATFHEQGIVEAYPGPTDLPGVPETIYVGTLPATPTPKLVAAAVSKAKRTPRTQLERIGWASHEQRRAFDAVRRRKS